MVTGDTLGALGQAGLPEKELGKGADVPLPRRPEMPGSLVGLDCWWHLAWDFFFMVRQLQR